MKMKPGSTLVFNGDSITDVGRNRPLGEGPYGLGQGYPALINGMLSAYRPGDQIRILNTAVSGDTIRKMETRWQPDTLELQPDWVSVMIGINDVWRHFDAQFHPVDAVNYEEYVSTYRSLIERTLPVVKGMVLMTPYYIDQNQEDPMTAMVCRYASAVRDLAREYGLVFCDVQSAFDEVQKDLHYMMFSADRVHPNGGNCIGHFVIARAWLQAMEAWPLP